MSINVLIKRAGNKFQLIKEFQKYANVYVEDDNNAAKCFLWADSRNKEPIDLVIDTAVNPFCNDKAEFNRFCRRHGFSIPETWICDKGQKFIIKPRNGSGGKGI